MTTRQSTQAWRYPEMKGANEQDLQILLDATRKAQRVVFVSGGFNVVHPGHLRLLRFAAECGDFLVVGVLGQASVTSRMLPEDLRLEGVKVISFVDHAFILRERPADFILRLRPAIVIKGREHENTSNEEAEVVQSYGGRLLFSSGESSSSAMDILEKEYFERNLPTIDKPMDFPERHRFEVKHLARELRAFCGQRVSVVGDLIVDDYIDCDPLGMSQEDPTIVVTPISTKRFIGGAGIVAAHAQGLGAEVSYFSVSGQDETARHAAETLSQYGVEHRIIEDGSRPTTLKQRYRAGGKTLLRVSHLRHHDLAPQIADQLFEAIHGGIKSTDLLIFSDFNYGCLPQFFVDRIADLCTQHNVMMVADSQSSSQLGNISRFKNTKVITPTEREARVALHDPSSGLVVLADGLRVKANTENVIIKLGSEGLLVHAKDGDGFVTDQLPAFNLAPKDTAGAGDSLLICTAMALRAGLNIWKSCYLGSLAAACQVARVGNIPLTQGDLLAEIESD